ncbi:MAG: tRNA pseudouridine(38-40) synthase TruA [Dehalococcoidia bacterium]|nr:tRNA pseudouridine(38-40) synthase TruA [Dehalococcoidia bacterium]
MTSADSAIQTRTFGLIVEYDGTELFGSQLQANARTVQGELEQALAKITGQRTRVRLAGRTDSGVHATGQVAAFDAEIRLETVSIRNALNYYLPEDVRVRCAQEAPPRFDPRRRARSREYVYTLNDAPSRPALHRRTEFHVRERLDEKAMHTAAQALTGEHDFAAFAGPATLKGASTVRRIDAAGVCREGDRVIFTVRGNAFLHQQVRRMAGALIDAGSGAMTLDQFKKVLGSGRKNGAKRLAGPQGLCLTKVNYESPGPCGLPEHASAS